ncbi:MAG: hypothetical protein HOC70_12060 [Gammaproteobacteria bacterium]|nr:hypothetical protein [Gammaproteobacteria bacterium]MBT4493971.1 hypothetical protein [Gammaproteobacteria bacterium]
MHRPLIQKTIEFLSKYIVFSKADLFDISDDLACYGSPGEADIDVGKGFRLALGNRTEFWLPSEQAVDAADDSSPWSDAELEAGIAWVTEATSEEYLPQMFNYHELGGIDFNKGCYLGQEIVARAQYRGELKRRLHRLHSKITRTIGETVSSGMIVSSAPSGLLAVLKNAANEPVTVKFEDGEEVEAIPCH